MEFKQLGSKGDPDPGKLDAQLEQLAEEALSQIHEKKYNAEARQRGVKQVINIGLGFCGKRFKLKSDSWHA